MNRSPPNLAQRVSAPTLSTMTFFGYRLRDSDSVRGRILPFFYLYSVAVSTVLALLPSLWLGLWQTQEKLVRKTRASRKNDAHFSREFLVRVFRTNFSYVCHGPYWSSTLPESAVFVIFCCCKCMIVVECV